MTRRLIGKQPIRTLYLKGLIKVKIKNLMEKSYSRLGTGEKIHKPEIYMKKL